MIPSTNLDQELLQLKVWLIMRKSFVVVGLLLLLASAVAAQGKSKSWLRGSWEGTGYQTDSEGESTWPMTLAIKRFKNGRRMFSIEYPSLACGGRWRLLSINGNKARFREELNHGQDTCANKGLVMIERIGGQLIFLYTNQGSHEVTASAVLNQRKLAGKQ
jgi:hypothetical protein